MGKNYKEAISSMYDRHFVSFTGYGNMFVKKSDKTENEQANPEANPEEIEKAKAVMDPFKPGYTSKNEGFNKVKNLLGELEEICKQPDRQAEKYDDVLKKISEINAGITGYLDGKEYSKDPEYRAVLRLKSEMKAFEFDMGSIGKIDAAFEKAKKDSQVKIPELKIADLKLKERTGKAYWEQMYKAVGPFYSESERKAARDKIEDKIMDDYYRMGTSRGSLVLNKVIVNHYKKRDEYYKTISRVHRKAVERLDGTIQSDDLQKYLKEHDYVQKTWKQTYYEMSNQVTAYNNVLAAKDLNPNVKKLRDLIVKKNNSKIGEKDYNDKLNKYLPSAMKDLQNAGKNPLTDDEKKFVEILNGRGIEKYKLSADTYKQKYEEEAKLIDDTFNRVDEFASQYIDKEAAKFSGLSAHEEAELSHARSLHNPENESFEKMENYCVSYRNDIKGSYNDYKKSLANYKEFLKEYADAINHYNEIKNQYDKTVEIITNRSRRDINKDTPVSEAKKGVFEAVIIDMAARLDKVKTRTFSKNSDEFEDMLGKVNAIREKLDKEADYKDSEAFMNDMKELNEFATKYSQAKGGAVRSTTQGQERLDIAHEIMATFAKENHIADDIEKVQITQDEIKYDDYTKMMENETKFFTEYCEKCNELLQKGNYRFDESKLDQPADLNELGILIANCEKEEKDIDSLINYHSGVDFDEDHRNYFVRKKPDDSITKYEKRFREGYDRYIGFYDSSYKHEFEWYENKIEKDKVYNHFKEAAKKPGYNRDKEIKVYVDGIAGKVKAFEDELADELNVELHGPEAAFKEKTSFREINLEQNPGAKQVRLTGINDYSKETDKQNTMKP